MKLAILIFVCQFHFICQLMMEEHELIDAIRKKDEKAFRALMQQYDKMAGRVILRITGDKDETLDLVQDVFVTVWEKIDTFREDASVSTWIYRLSVNKALNHLRWKKLRNSLRLTDRKTEEKMKSSTNHTNNDAPGKIEKEEDENVLTKALSLIPATQRAAFILSKGEGLSNPEIAGILHISVSAVESLNFRAKQSLSKILFSYFNDKLK